MRIVFQTSCSTGLGMRKMETLFINSTHYHHRCGVPQQCRICFLVTPLSSLTGRKELPVTFWTRLSKKVWGTEVSLNQARLFSSCSSPVHKPLSFWEPIPLTLDSSISMDRCSLNSIDSVFAFVEWRRKTGSVMVLMVTRCHRGSNE